MSSDDVVIINDDPDPVQDNDEDVELVAVSGPGISNSDPIIIDDECNNINKNDSDIEIIDVPNPNKPEHKNSKQLLNPFASTLCLNKRLRAPNQFERIYKENKLFIELIEKCLDIEHSEGMLRVIDRCLIKAYDALDEDYKKSPDFEKLLNVKMIALDVDPDHKFSIVRDLWETMKCHRKRKRVTLITLSTSTSTPKKKNTVVPNKRRKKPKRLTAVRNSKKMKLQKEYMKNKHAVREPVIIDLEMPVDLEQEKENNSFSIEIDKNFPIEENNTRNIQDSLTKNNSINNDFASVIETQSPLLVPSKSEEYKLSEEVTSRIRDIESQIKFFEKQIKLLEEKEVDEDSPDSPYIQCEKLKERIVCLYRELCSLTGVEPVKQRKVYFKVTDGRPPQPVQFLEKHINDNIGPDGNPHFPDFNDVVECVSRANATYQLGYSQTQINNEAMALFVQCGRALQLNRQKRDWRNMVSRVKREVETDPAEEDPILMARLQENKKIAVKNETDLLDRFVKMEHSLSSSEPVSNAIQLVTNESDDSDYDEPGFNHNEVDTNATQTQPSNNISQVPEEMNVNQSSNTLTAVSDGMNAIHPSSNVMENLKDMNGFQTFNNVAATTTNTKVIQPSNNITPLPGYIRLIQPSNNVAAIPTCINIIQPCHNITAIPEYINVIQPSFNATEISKHVNVGVLPNTVTKSTEFLNARQTCSNISVFPKHMIAVEPLENTTKIPECLYASQSTSNVTTIPIHMNAVGPPNNHSKIPEGLCASQSFSYVTTIPIHMNVVGPPNNHTKIPEGLCASQSSSNVTTIPIQMNAVGPPNNYTKIPEGLCASQSSSNVTTIPIHMNANRPPNSDTKIPEGLKVIEISSNITGIPKYVIEKPYQKTTEVEPIENESKKIDTDKNNAVDEISKEIKREPSDILKEMEKFGNSLTSTIISIDDPFLIIEISSDSSDESDSDDGL